MAIPVESFFLIATAGGTLQQQIRQIVAEGILAADPELEHHGGLRAAIERRVSDDDRAALSKN